MPSCGILEPMTTEQLTIYASGHPCPMGSKRLVGTRSGDLRRVRMIDQGSHTLKAWQAVIIQATREAIQEQGWTPLAEGTPVKVRLAFTLQPPQDLARKIAKAPHLPAPMPKMPDVDKLARAVLDPLSGRAFHDDRQVAHLTALKRYAGSLGALSTPGVEIAVAPWTP